MSNHGEELTRFHSSGKTFFFNKVDARNDRWFLGINGLWGQGERDRMVVFPEQLMMFREHLDRAIEQLFGVSRSESVFKQCPECQSRFTSWQVAQSRDQEDWVLFCGECREILLGSRTDYDKAKEAVFDEE